MEEPTRAFRSRPGAAQMFPASGRLGTSRRGGLYFHGYVTFVQHQGVSRSSGGPERSGRPLGRGPRSARGQAREGRDRLLQVFQLAHDLVGPRLEGPGEVKRGGQHGHPCPRARVLDRAHDVGAAAVGEHEVDDRQVEPVPLGDQAQGLLYGDGAAEHGYLAAFLGDAPAEHELERAGEEYVVLDYQDSRHARSVPRPSLELASRIIRHWWGRGSLGRRPLTTGYLVK